MSPFLGTGWPYSSGQHPDIARPLMLLCHYIRGETVKDGALFGRWRSQDSRVLGGEGLLK